MTQIHGQCDKRFKLVERAFLDNFDQHEELGASVCITLNGKKVVDLWGGIANPDDNKVYDRRVRCIFDDAIRVCLLTFSRPCGSADAQSAVRVCHHPSFNHVYREVITKIHEKTPPPRPTN